MKNLLISVFALSSLLCVSQANAAQSGLEQGMMEYMCESGDSSDAAATIADWMNRGYDQIYTLGEGLIVGCGMMSPDENEYGYEYDEGDGTTTSRRRR